MAHRSFIEVDYRFPPGTDVLCQAKTIAVGQTAGSAGARYPHRNAVFRSHLAEVVDIRQTENSPGLATVRFPTANVEGDIPTLLTMIFGKYSMAGPAKVVDVRLPAEYGLRAHFGIRGIRQRVGVEGRPLVMAIFKPSLGLSADDHAALLHEVAAAGLDVIKDDEIMADLAPAPTMERWLACREVLRRVEADTGRRMIYAVNVTGPAGTIRDTARRLVEEGAPALLLNVLSYGYSVLEALVSDPEVGVPLSVHPALAGALCAAPDHGLSYPVVLGTLMAHAGADAVLCPAHYGSLPFDPADECRIREILQGRGVFPVPSAGVHPGMVPRIIADYGNDVILNSGTGIMDHPDGPAAGVTAFREALELHRNKTEMTRQTVPEGPLRRALETWGWPR
jgi:2,3-diketo-5-methylthiopentyl-1-phosphate enolase